MDKVNSVQVIAPVQVAPYWYQVDAPVILDTTLSAQSKVVYAIISGLTQKSGECWASNKYIGELLGCGEQTISRAVSELKKAGHIKDVEETPYRRTLVLNYVRRSYPQAEEGGIPDLTRGVVKNDMGGSQKRLTNITSIILQDNNTERKGFAPPSYDEVSLYCKERNNTINPETFVDFYTARDWIVGKTKMKDWKAAIRTWEHRRSEDSAKKGGQYGRQTNSDRTVDSVNSYINSLGQGSD